MTNVISVKDPVCGMELEAATAAEKAIYKGQMHYFCGSTCKEKFDRNAERYLGEATKASPNGHTCCS